MLFHFPTIEIEIIRRLLRRLRSSQIRRRPNSIFIFTRLKKSKISRVTEFKANGPICQAKKVKKPKKRKTKIEKNLSELNPKCFIFVRDIQSE